MLCHGISKISKLISIQTVVGKVFRRNIQARLQFLFPKTKVTSIFAVGFLYSQHWWTKKNRDEIKINTFSKIYFSCSSEIKSLSQYDNYTCLKPMYSLHNLLKSKILYKSSRHRKVEVLTLFSLLMTKIIVHNHYN